MSLGSWRDRAKQSLPVLLALGASWLFLASVSISYPIKNWLLWHMAGAWILAGLWVVGLVGSADFFVRRAMRGSLHQRERLVFSLAVGLLGFFLVVFVSGLLHLYGRAFFVVTLLALVAGAGLGNFKYVIRVARLMRDLRGRAKRARTHSTALLVFGVVGFLLVYYKAFSLEHASYDARWYHFPIAEQYVSQGGVARFPEGWYLGAFPHLASYLFAWALMSPLGDVADKVQLASHMELATFGAILFSIPALTRHILRGRRLPEAWTAFFLFPAIFVHDGNLTLGADHFAALWTVPIVLAMFRLWPRGELKYAVLFALVASGSANTKYSAVSAWLPASVAVAGRLAWLAVAPRQPARQRWGALRTLAIVLGLSLLLTTPHWLKNLLWYGDPLYPVLHRWAPVHPWYAEARAPFENFFRRGCGVPIRAAEFTVAGILAAAQALFSFSFIPHDWVEFHGAVPIFGSLFTLLIPIVVFVPRPGRIAGIYLLLHASLLVWLYTQPEDRYLQQVLPAMAAVVAAVLQRAWQLGRVARAALVVLVGAQIAWGLDTPFIPSDNMVAEGSELRASEALASSGYRRDEEARRRPLEPYLTISRFVPSTGKVLTHEVQTSMGLGRAVANDVPTDQAFFGYSRYRNARDVYDALRSVGVTHVVWRHEISQGRDSIAGDLTFFWFVANFGMQLQHFAWLDLVELPTTPPIPVAVPDSVAFLGCGADLRDGLYRLGDLATSPFDEHPVHPQPYRVFDEKAPLRAAGFLVKDSRCHPSGPADDPDFRLLARRGGYVLLGRGVDSRTMSR
jgi:hypothetical protein